MRPVHVTQAEESPTPAPHPPHTPLVLTRCHSPRRKKNLIGRWKSGSKMGERYDRSNCAQELFLRDSSITNITCGWAPVGSYGIPELASAVVSKTPLVGGSCEFPPPDLGRVVSDSLHRSDPAVPVTDEIQDGRTPDCTSSGGA